MTMLTLKELDEVITSGWIMFDMINKRPADSGITIHDTDNNACYDTKRGWSNKPPKRWKKVISTKNDQHTVDRRVLFDFDPCGQVTLYFFSYMWRKSPVKGSLSDPKWELRAVACFDDFGEGDDSCGLFLLEDKDVSEACDTDELIRYIMDGCNEYEFNMKGMISNPEMLKNMREHFIDYITVSMGHTAGINTSPKNSKAVRLMSRIGEYRDIGLRELTNLMWTMATMSDRSDLKRDLIEKFLDKKAYTALEEYIKRKDLFVTDEISLLINEFERRNIYPQEIYSYGSLRMFEQMAYINKKTEESGGADSVSKYFNQLRDVGLNRWAVSDVDVAIAGAYSQIKRGRSVSEVFDRLRASNSKTA